MGPRAGQPLSSSSSSLQLLDAAAPDSTRSARGVPVDPRRTARTMLAGNLFYYPVLKSRGGQPFCLRAGPLLAR